MRSLLALGLSALAVAASPPPARIGFPAAVESRVGDYRARLAGDAPGDSALLELRLSRPGGGRENLLESATMSHGLQPFTFAASDFAGGIAGSAFGRMRTIPIRASHRLLRVTVLRATAAKTGTGLFPWRFRALDLALAIEPEPPRR
jgi:hypothetical protein